VRKSNAKGIKKKNFYWLLVLLIIIAGWIFYHVKGPFILHDIALAKDRKGDLHSAVRYFGKAIRLNPRIHYFYTNRGISYSKIGYLDEALEDFGQALRLKGDDANALNSRGITFLRNGNFEQAVSDFTKAITLNLPLGSAFVNRGIAYIRLKQYELALKDFEYVISKYPIEPDSYTYIGIVHVEKGNVKKGIEYFTKAAGLGDKNAISYLKRYGIEYTVKQK